ncbi:unnamed protein product [Symbiodinium sp. CCMP2592]|nr:unnamed protein product [Symbiodinium sp. CCMP2592]
MKRKKEWKKQGHLEPQQLHLEDEARWQQRKARGLLEARVLSRIGLPEGSRNFVASEERGVAHSSRSSIPRQALWEAVSCCCPAVPEREPEELQFGESCAQMLDAEQHVLDIVQCQGHGCQQAMRRSLNLRQWGLKSRSACGGHEVDIPLDTRSIVNSELSVPTCSWIHELAYVSIERFLLTLPLASLPQISIHRNSGWRAGGTFERLGTSVDACEGGAAESGGGVGCRHALVTWKRSRELPAESSHAPRLPRPWKRFRDVLASSMGEWACVAALVQLCRMVPPVSSERVSLTFRWVREDVLEELKHTETFAQMKQVEPGHLYQDRAGRAASGRAGAQEGSVSEVMKRKKEWKKQGHLEPQQLHLEDEARWQQRKARGLLEARVLSRIGLPEGSRNFVASEERSVAHSSRSSIPRQALWEAVSCCCPAVPEREPEELQFGGRALQTEEGLNGHDRDTSSGTPRMASTGGGGQGEQPDHSMQANAGAEAEGAKDGEGSPQKRGRTQEQPLTLALLREVLAQEREIDRNHLAQRLETVQGDVKAIRGRVDAVETGVTMQMQNTMTMLTKVTDNYDVQSKALGELKVAQQQLEKRLEAMEHKPFSSAPGSTTADTEGGTGKPPALIMGGWHPDQPAEETLQAAKTILRRLDVQLNPEDAFVPGLRRGYAIIPIKPKPFESEDERRTRVQGAMQRVRNANVTTGTDDSGNMRKLWIALSQSPERRRRAKLAGKVKRLVLELGGNKTDMEVEFATGTVWMVTSGGSTKVSSCSAEQPATAEKVGAGWVDVTAIAKAMRKTLQEVQTAWGPRKAELLWHEGQLGGKFHQRDRGEHSQPMRVATWNVGGLTAQHVLEATQHFSGDPDLELLRVLLLQEVVTEPGVFFAEQYGWTVAFGKNEGDWRGTGVAYKTSTAHHSNTQLLPVGIATTLTDTAGKRGVRFLSGHIPHHATIAQTEQYLGEWSNTLSKARVVLGMDANEQFTQAEGEGWHAHTGRGEAILAAMADKGLNTPEQQLTTPSYHPYNTAMRSRRLDYLAVRGLHTQTGRVAGDSRHLARSDHDLVWIDVTVGGPPPKPKPTWGARRYAKHVNVQNEATIPPSQTDTHTAISQLACRITVAGRETDRFTESNALKGLRRQARGAPQHLSREAWEKVARVRQQEQRAWHQALVNKASHANWRAKRALETHTARRGWQHQLTDDPEWRHKLRGHFASIFAKAPAQRTAQRLAETRGALTKLCKHTPWRPFTRWDLELATRTWKKGKAAGPDAITHEILWLLMQEQAWGDRILYMMNDFLYKGSIPEEDGAPLQWGARGKQAPELLVVLRRVIRHAKDWNIPTWIVKLDVRKAFDSVWQESMGQVVAGKARRGRKHRRDAMGGQSVNVPQTNGVRQGSPDSPVLFGRVVADDLEGPLNATQHLLPPKQEGPPPPQSGGAYMDDTYLWSYDRDHLQASLAELERRLRQHGLTINPGKTAIIYSRPEGGGTFRIGGDEVACKPFGEVITALGSPITFGEEVAAVVAEMNHCAPTSLDSRIKLHQTLVRGAALWGGEAWQVTDAVLQAANSTQLTQVRRMMHPGRRPGETWAEWHVRTMRGARVALHKAQVLRWSTYVLERVWDIYGHMPGRSPGGDPCCCGRTWNGGAKKSGSRAAKGSTGTKDQKGWSIRGAVFVEKFDVEWSSGQQQSLTNLTPNNRVDQLQAVNMSVHATASPVFDFEALPEGVQRRGPPSMARPDRPGVLGHLGPFPVEAGTLTSQDREEIRQETGCTVGVRGRSQWGSRCLTVCGPPSRLMAAKEMAEERIANSVEDARAPKPKGPAHGPPFGPLSKAANKGKGKGPAKGAFEGPPAPKTPPAAPRPQPMAAPAPMPGQSNGELAMQLQIALSRISTLETSVLQLQTLQNYGGHQSALHESRLRKVEADLYWQERRPPRTRSRSPPAAASNSGQPAPARSRSQSAGSGSSSSQQESPASKELLDEQSKDPVILARKEKDDAIRAMVLDLANAYSKAYEEGRCAVRKPKRPSKKKSSPASESSESDMEDATLKHLLNLCCMDSKATGGPFEAGLTTSQQMELQERLGFISDPEVHARKAADAVPACLKAPDQQWLEERLGFSLDPEVHARKAVEKRDQGDQGASVLTASPFEDTLSEAAIQNMLAAGDHMSAPVEPEVSRSAAAAPVEDPLEQPIFPQTDGLAAQLANMDPKAIQQLLSVVNMKLESAKAVKADDHAVKRSLSFGSEVSTTYGNDGSAATNSVKDHDEAELREREAEIAQNEREHKLLKSQEKLRQQLRDREDRRAAKVTESNLRRQSDDVSPEEKPAACVITRQMQLGLTAAKRSKATDENEGSEPETGKAKPKSKAKAKAKSKAAAKGKAKAKAKSSGSKKKQPAASTTAAEEDADGPPEAEEAVAASGDEEADAPPEEALDESVGEPPKGNAKAGKRPKVFRSMSKRRLACKGSTGSASKKGSRKSKAGKPGKAIADGEDGEELAGEADDNDEGSWSWPAGGIIAGRVNRKRKAAAGGAQRGRAKKNKAKATEEIAEPPTEADDPEEKEEPHNEPEDKDAPAERQTFARRTCADRGWNKARWEAIRDAYNAKIRCFVIGHSDTFWSYVVKNLKQRGQTPEVEEWPTVAMDSAWEFLRDEDISS